MTQIEDILAALKQGRYLTQRGVAHELECYRLGARIYDLRQRGIPVVTRKVPPTYHAEYYLEEADR